MVVLPSYTDSKVASPSASVVSLVSPIVTVAPLIGLSPSLTLTVMSAILGFGSVIYSSV